MEWKNAVKLTRMGLRRNDGGKGISGPQTGIDFVERYIQADSLKIAIISPGAFRTTSL